MSRNMRQVAQGLMSYVGAVGLTLLAFAATALFKRAWNGPSFMFFVPAIAIAAWRGGRGPAALDDGSAAEVTSLPHSIQTHVF